MAYLILMACQTNPNIMIAGDFTDKEIDWLNEYAPQDKQHQNIFIEEFQEDFIHQHVSKPTRYRKKS